MTAGEREQVGDFRVGWLAPEDAAEARRLFEAVFGAPISPAMWAWKYGDGRGQGVGVWTPDGQLVGHYGAMPRRIGFFGEPAMGVQIGDVMVRTDARAAASRRGPFALMTAYYLDREIGHGCRHLVGFGFPSSRHMKLAEILGLYKAVGRIQELTWPVAPWHDRWHTLQPLDLGAPGTTARIDALWQALREDTRHCVIPVRDGAWWSHRFGRHPDHRYQALALRQRLTGRLRGAVVLREHPGSGGLWELMDWVAPVAQGEALVRAAAGWVHARGGTLFKAWCSEAVSARIRGHDGQVADLDVLIPTSVRRPGPAPESLQGHWWLTGGDTDFR